MTGQPLAEHVVVVLPTDNVAVVKFGLGAGDQLQVPDEPDLTVTADVKRVAGFGGCTYGGYSPPPRGTETERR